MIKVRLYKINFCSRQLKKLNIILFLLLLYFFIPKTVSAEWTKYSENPILSGTPGFWDSRDVLCSHVIFEGGIYKMWYTGNSGSGWNIGYAYSSDGIANWQKYPAPVIQRGSPDGWERDVAYPNVLIDEHQYKMWYISISSNWSSSSPDRARVRYATSHDGIDWDEGDWVLRGTPGEWDSGTIDRGLTVLKMGGEYKMWYAGGNEAPMGGSEERWNIGYATSPDGIHWTKYPGNPVVTATEPWERNSVSYPNVIYEDGLYHMFYAATSLNLPVSIVYATSTDGIHWQKPADKNPILSQGLPGSFDQYHVASPFVIKEGNKFRMWYDGLGSSNHWQIGYAEGYFTSPTRQPIVILPGLGASWNYQALILGQNQPQTAWRMTPGVRVYDGLIETLENAGYQKDKNLWVFNYDWRQPVDQTADQLAQFLQNQVYSQGEGKIDLIGHSLGGLVARAYLQKYPDHQVDQLITLGSPHQGSLKVYPIWEGGILANSLPVWQRWLISLLLQLNRKNYWTPSQAVREFAPGLKDLLPVFSYLKKQGQPVPINTMNQQNIWLKGLNETAGSQVEPFLHAFSGRIPDSTWRWLQVTPPSWAERLMGVWADGKPTGQEEFEEGDETVLRQSAEFGSQVIGLAGADHRQIVTLVSSQAEIMKVLGLTPTAISPTSQGVSYSPALIFHLASPASLTVFDPDGEPLSFQDHQTVFVPGAPAGRYRIKINGTGQGSYHLYLGEIFDDQERWHTLVGLTRPDQQDEYWFEFNSYSPSANPWSGQEAKICQQSIPPQLEALKQQLSAAEWVYLEAAKRWLSHQKDELAILNLYRLHQKISPKQLVRLQNEIIAVINNIQDSCSLLKDQTYPAAKLRQEIKATEKYLTRMRGTSAGQAAVYLLAQQKLALAKSTSGYQAHLHALGAKQLAVEGLRWW